MPSLAEMLRRIGLWPPLPESPDEQRDARVREARERIERASRAALEARADLLGRIGHQPEQR